MITRTTRYNISSKVSLQSSLEQKILEAFLKQTEDRIHQILEGSFCSRQSLINASLFVGLTTLGTFIEFLLVSLLSVQKFKPLIVHSI